MENRLIKNSNEKLSTLYSFTVVAAPILMLMKLALLIMYTVITGN